MVLLLAETPAFCFVLWKTEIHAITASGGSWEVFYISTVYPRMKLSLASE